MDFSTLSDEQLIELIKGALAETIKRGQTVVDAAREVMLDEKREAEIRFKAQEIAKEKILRQEAERIAKEEEAKILAKQRQSEEQKAIDAQKKNWAAKKSQAERMLSFFDGNIWINVWKSGNEKRVYINDGEPFGKRTKEVACYYATGNAKRAPNTFTGDDNYWNKLSPEQREEFKALVIEISNYWGSTKFSARDAAQYNG